MNWKRFHFESNQFFDTVRGMEDWQRLRSAYPEMTDEQLLNAKEAFEHLPEEERDRRPNYGFRWEHDGERTLRDFFNKHKMTL